MLGRVVSYHSWGWSLEADPSLLELAVDRLGLSEAKGVSTPGAKPDDGCSSADVRSRRLDPKLIDNPDHLWPGGDQSRVLNASDAKLYQSVAALLNFSSLDRPEMMFSVKELMRKMAAPTAQDEMGLKRVVRFLKTLPRLVASYAWAPLSQSLEIYTDSVRTMQGVFELGDPP